MPIAVIVDWYGPYNTLRDFRAEVEYWLSGTRTLYMALGSHNRCNYVGLTGRPDSRFRQHPKMLDERNKRFFVGEITSQGVSGRRSRVTKPDLHIAEHALIRCLSPLLNDRRKLTDPEDCVVVYSRFFDPEEVETPTNPLRRFPSVIAYNSWSREWEV